jgi:exonuclease III
MTLNELRVTGWNMNGYYTSQYYLYEVLAKADIVCLSEHKLYDCELNQLRDMANSMGFICDAKQSYDLMPWNHGTIIGHCGVAIMYRKSIEHCIAKLHNFQSDRLCGIEISC